VSVADEPAVARVHFVAKAVEIERPRLPAISAEVDSPYVRKDVAARGPAHSWREKENLANRPGVVKDTSAPGLPAAGGAMDPAFHARRNLSTCHPPHIVVDKKSLTIEDVVDRTPALPIHSTIGARAIVNAGRIYLQIRQQAELFFKPAVSSLRS